MVKGTQIRDGVAFIIMVAAMICLLLFAEAHVTPPF